MSATYEFWNKLIPNQEDIDKAKQEVVCSFNNYLKDLKISVLDNKKVDIDAIMSDYFNSRPPFGEKSSSKGKKNEFPDAIMISNIKNNLMEKENLIILSSDCDFEEAFDKKIMLYKELEELLTYLNKSVYGDMYLRVIQYTNSDSMKELLPREIESGLSQAQFKIVKHQYDHNMSENWNLDNLLSGHRFSKSSTKLAKIEKLKTKLANIVRIDSQYVELRYACNALLHLEVLENDNDFLHTNTDPTNVFLNYWKSENLKKIEKHIYKFEVYVTISKDKITNPSAGDIIDSIRSEYLYPENIWGIYLGEETKIK